MDGFPRGQRGQTVNLLATLSKVRILLHPLGESRCADQGSKLNGCYQPADVAQLAEQLICNQQVIGSSPIIGFYFYIDAGWSSLEARRAHNPKVIGSNPIPATYAQIAQLVEQRTENPRVAGSIPALGIFSCQKLPQLLLKNVHRTFFLTEH